MSSYSTDGVTEMKTAIVTFLAATGLLLGSGVAVANTPLGTTTPGEHSAQVNGGPASSVNDIYDVQFIAINGTNIPAREVFWLRPGSYTLTVRVIADHARHTLMRRTNEPRGWNTIDVVVEPGKVYEVRAKFDRKNRRQPYSVVLHRVIE